METINITIPAELTKTQEIAAIAGALGKKMIPTKSQLLLEGSYVVGNLDTQIIIKREFKSPVTVTRECSMCKTIYSDDVKVLYWHNYGGKPTKAYMCSNSCRINILNLLGDRAAISRYKLKRLITF